MDINPNQITTIIMVVNITNLNTINPITTNLITIITITITITATNLINLDDRDRHSHSSSRDRNSRHGSHDRDRRRDRSRDRNRYYNDRRDRDNRRDHRDRHDSRGRDNYNRYQSHNNNGGQGGYGVGGRYNNGYGGGNGYGGKGGGFRGNGGGYGGGRRGSGYNGAAKDKYEVSSIHEQLLRSIKDLSLDDRGAQPLRKWIDEKTKTEYHESRYKKGSANIVKEDGKIIKKKAIKIEDIPNTAELKWDINSDYWLEGIPKGQNDLTLAHPQTVNVHTNSIRIDDRSLTVHQYTFDIYDNQSQKIDNKENRDFNISGENHNNMESQSSISRPSGPKLTLSEDRRREIFTKLRRQLRPLYPVNFDNMHIFSFKKDVLKEPLKIIKPKQFPEYIIVLERQYSTDPTLKCNSSQALKRENHNDKNEKTSFHQLYKQCAPQFQEQGLNIINRQRFFGANYTQLHRREDRYYSLQNLREMEIWPQNGCDLELPDLRCLSGYKSTVTYGNYPITKTQLANKLITKHSIHDFIKQHGIRKVDAFIRGKRAVTNYSNQIIELDGLDADKNLDSTFSMDNNQSISYRDYYEQRKKGFDKQRIRLLEDQEEAMVIHHRYTGRGDKKQIVDTIHYPPQLLFLIVPVEQHNDRTKSKMRRIAHPPVQQIINRSIKINQELSDINRLTLFTTEKRTISCKGYYLEPPLICFKSKRGVQKELATSFNGRVWRNVNGFWNNVSELYDDKKSQRFRGIDWAICYDRNGRNRDRFARDIQGLLTQFDSGRGFERGQEPLNRPRLMGMDYNNLPSIREELRQSSFKVVLFILANNSYGCKLKVDITRHVLFYQEPHSALSTPNASPKKESRHSRSDKHYNNLSMDLQFICEPTIKKRAAVFNVFETILLKSKTILYYLQPQLPSNKFNYHRLWMIGIKVLRKKGGAHLVTLSCNRAPFVGTIKYITNHSSMITSERDVIPQTMMYQLVTQLLTASVKKVKLSKGDEMLPFNIVLLRSSGGDGLLKTIISKELAGFKRALSEFTRTHSELVRDVNNGTSKWYPGVIFSVLQENVPDAFGIDDGRGKIIDSPKALCVNQEITSSQYFDLFISLPTKQEKQLYGRVIRLITLSDDYNDTGKTHKRPDCRLRKEAHLLSDYVSLIYSSIWSYALNIPFPKVPNFPAPIKFAEHYASWQYSILTDNDTDLNDLDIDIDNAKPKICKPIMENDENDIQMK